MQSVFATRRVATRSDRNMLRGARYTSGVLRADATTPPGSVFFFLTGEAFDIRGAPEEEVSGLLARSTMNFTTTWLDADGESFPVAVDAHTHPRSVELRRAALGQHNCVIVTIPDSTAAVNVWGLPAGVDVQLGHAVACTRALAAGEELLLPAEGSTAADLDCDGFEHDESDESDESDEEIDVDMGYDSEVEDESDDGMEEAEEELYAAFKRELAEEQEQESMLLPVGEGFSSPACPPQVSPAPWLSPVSSIGSSPGEWRFCSP